jgi:hypothetical protein
MKQLGARVRPRPAQIGADKALTEAEILAAAGKPVN